MEYSLNLMHKSCFNNRFCTTCDYRGMCELTQSLKPYMISQNELMKLIKYKFELNFIEFSEKVFEICTYTSKCTSCRYKGFCYINYLFPCNFESLDDYQTALQAAELE